ncbi:FAD linked oxidase-like protein [Estrella lausannensis]|uniref:FAD linked oxidase-like protein n=2 Tax=Estrella lausannensis TaxID=483423 RepID=A0A0H5DQF3_9BACT|nr:FAD linked oxidase-like protein [Estrella lausannensis]
MGKLKKEIAGWGGMAKGETCLFRPEKIEHILRGSPLFSARGLGRSYGDASLNTGGEVILMERLNRLLSFNAENHVLKAEAGATIRDIVETFSTKGYFVPVTPGTKEATLGGCLAADAHGKNHHADGSFSDHVLEFELMLPDGTKRRVRRQDEELFYATAGGMGLTGVITEVTLKLLPVETPFIKVLNTPFESLTCLIKKLNESSDAARYSVAWLDLLSFKNDKVNSILIEGDHAKRGELPDKLKSKEAKPISIPFSFPSLALNRTTQKLFNKIYFYQQKKKGAPFFCHYNPFFYPLDRIGNWNRMYGSRGFYQYQFVVPEANAEEALRDILAHLTAARCPVYLAVLKKFGKKNPGYLSFPMEGFTLAMDIPGNQPDLFHLLCQLDLIVMKNHGRVYLAKDFHVTPDVFRAMYPDYTRFLAVKRKVDPANLIQTDLARRLRIGEQ